MLLPLNMWICCFWEAMWKRKYYFCVQSYLFIRKFWYNVVHWAVHCKNYWKCLTNGIDVSFSKGPFIISLGFVWIQLLGFVLIKNSSSLCHLNSHNPTYVFVMQSSCVMERSSLFGILHQAFPLCWSSPTFQMIWEYAISSTRNSLLLHSLHLTLCWDKWTVPLNWTHNGASCPSRWYCCPSRIKPGGWAVSQILLQPSMVG